MEWLSFIFTVIGLILSYIGTRGEIERIRHNRNRSRLEKDKTFYEALHASPIERSNYLTHSILIVCAIFGAVLMFQAMAVDPDGQRYTAYINWAAGLSTYMFSLYRLGRYRRATASFDKNIKRIDDEIKSLEKQQGRNSE